MKKHDNEGDSTLARNRKAFHDYEIMSKVEAGIELQGTEVKSCRARNISLVDTYARIENGEVFLVGAHIAPYENGNRFNHEPRRRRRLLMHKKEILRLNQQIREKGLTVVPLSVYLSKNRVKVELAICRGKSTVDKRDSLRRKDDQMTMRRAVAAAARNQ